MQELSVGVREFKARLSEYLRRVKAGQSIIITEHGQPVGRLMPAAAPLEARLHSLVQSGLAEWNGQRVPPVKLTARSKSAAGISNQLIAFRIALHSFSLSPAGPCARQN